MAFSLGAVPQQGAVVSASDLLAMAKAMNPVYQALASAGTTDTLSAAQMLSGVYVRSGATAAVTATTDTATNIIAAIPNATVGQTFLLFYANLNTSSGAVTVAAGTGVTTGGTLTIPIAGLRVFVGTVTNITAGSQTVYLQSAFSVGAGVAA